MIKLFKKSNITKEEKKDNEKYGGEGYLIADDAGVPLKYEQAIKRFDSLYKLSLKKREYSREFILELYRANKEKQKYEEEKKLYMEIVQGFTSVDIEDETDVMNYEYVELNGSDEIKKFPEVGIIWSFSIKGMPLKYFAKSKEEVHKVIKAFYDDDLSEIRNNYIIEVKKDIRKRIEIPNYLMRHLEKIKSNEKTNKNDLKEKLKKLDMMIDTEIIRDVLYEKIENYIKENGIKEVTFDTGEIYGYNRIMDFIKENLVQPY